MGDQLPLDEAGPGEVLGEMSFLEGSVTSATVVADGPVEVDVVDGARVQALLDAEPLLAAHFYQSLAVTLAERLRHSRSEFAPVAMSWG
jgi:CRP-like cAMP-binding protein